MTDEQHGEEPGRSVQVSRHRVRQIWISVVVVLVLLIGVPAAFKYAENKKMERNYQDTMQEVQEIVSDYVVRNYVGVTKVEWQGVGVESLSNELIAFSSSLNYIDSEARVYVNNTDFFTVEFRLHDVAEYDPDIQQFVLNDMLTPRKLEDAIRMDLEAKLSSTSPSEKHLFDGFVKSTQGSPDAAVIYNLDIFKFDWA